MKKEYDLSKLIEVDSPLQENAKEQKCMAEKPSLDFQEDVNQIPFDQIIDLYNSVNWVAATTLTIPHPYSLNDAKDWISRHPDWSEKGQVYTWAITDKDKDALYGCISLAITSQHRRGMLGFWIGNAFWNSGYCTEATKKVIQFGFEKLKLNKIDAFHIESNPASGKVMSKAGMEKEGYFRKHIIKNNEPMDCVFYGILPPTS